MFGIEIRKKGQLSNIYRDVDEILKKNNIQNKSINRLVIKNGVAHALQHMICVQNYFSVCTINECVKLSQVSPSYERLALYQTQHCVHWNEMLPEFKEQLIAMVLDDFREVITYDEKQEILEKEILINGH